MSIFKITFQPKRRKSERLAQKKHDACSGALFSDNEEVENIDTVSETSEQVTAVLFGLIINACFVRSNGMVISKNI